MNVDTTQSLASAVRTLSDLEDEDARLSLERRTLNERLAEIGNGESERMRAMADAHHAVIAAAKRESA